MNVGELIEALKDLDPTMEVILQKDAEGNGYSPLDGSDPDAVYVPDTTYSGEVYTAYEEMDELTLELLGMEQEDWEKIKSMPRALILFPVN